MKHQELPLWDVSALPTECLAGQELSLLLVSSAAASPSIPAAQISQDCILFLLSCFSSILWSSGKALRALQVCDSVVSACPAHRGPFSPCLPLTSRTPRFPSGSAGLCPLLECSKFSTGLFKLPRCSVLFSPVPKVSAAANSVLSLQVM